jgi:hypothetical protein
MMDAERRAEILARLERLSDEDLDEVMLFIDECQALVDSPGLRPPGRT